MDRKDSCSGSLTPVEPAGGREDDTNRDVSSSRSTHEQRQLTSCGDDSNADVVEVQEEIAELVISLDEDESVDSYGAGLPHSIGSDIPLLDQTILSDLEQHARRVADSLGLMTGHLTNALHYMSAITVQCMDSYQQAVTEVGQTVDMSIKTTYALIAKCEAVANSMQPVEQLAYQVYPPLSRCGIVVDMNIYPLLPVCRHDIKQTLDILERLCK